MESLPVIQRTYELYKCVANFSAHVDKRYRYTLGHELEQTALLALRFQILTKNAPRSLKLGYLLIAISYVELLQFHLRALLELNLANETTIFKSQEMVMEVARMLGGWKKFLQ